MPALHYYARHCMSESENGKKELLDVIILHVCRKKKKKRRHGTAMVRKQGEKGEETERVGTEEPGGEAGRERGVMSPPTGSQ